MVAGQADAIQVVRMVAVREDAILVARMGADQGDAILVARMAADQADAIPVVRMVADPEAEILAALMVARKERTPAALPVAVRKIADPGDAHRAVANCCLAVANRLDARLHCVGSKDVRRLPTGLARGAFPLQTLEPRNLAAGERVDRRRPALEDAAPKTEAQTGVGLTILPRTVERQVDQPQDLAVLASRWEAPGDRAPASWDRHQVECSRLRVDPVAAWPRSGAAFHLAER
jgi:hypothetical protein